MISTSFSLIQAPSEDSEAPGLRPGRALLPTWPAAWVRVGDRRAAASAERRACGISPSKKVGFTAEHGDLLTCFSMRKEDLWKHGGFHHTKVKHAQSVRAGPRVRRNGIQQQRLFAQWWFQLWFAQWDCHLGPTVLNQKKWYDYNQTRRLHNLNMILRLEPFTWTNIPSNQEILDIVTPRWTMNVVYLRIATWYDYNHS